MPDIEFYVIFPGKCKDKPELLSFARLFPDIGNNMDFKVKVLYGENDGIAIDQYVAFCKTLSRRIKEKGRTIEAIEETIRACVAAGVLKEYLQVYEKEVTAILEALFNRK